MCIRDSTKELNNLIKKHSHVFREQPRVTNMFTHKIEVTKESKFICRTYPIPKAYQQQVDAEIQQMLKNQIIERSDSDFLNPLVVVKKKTGVIRLCLDMRNINIITKKIYDCEPNADSLLIKCQGVQYMTRLDLTLSLIHI